MYIYYAWYIHSTASSICGYTLQHYPITHSVPYSIICFYEQSSLHTLVMPILTILVIVLSVLTFTSLSRRASAAHPIPPPTCHVGTLPHCLPGSTVVYTIFLFPSTAVDCCSSRDSVLICLRMIWYSWLLSSKRVYLQRVVCSNQCDMIATLYDTHIEQT